MSQGKRNEPLLTLPYAGLHLRVIWWDWKDIMHSTKSDAVFKYCYQLNRLRAAIDEKLTESISWYQNSVTFHQENARPRVSLQTRQKLVQPVKMSYQIHRTHLTFYIQIFTYLDPYRIILMGRTLVLWKGTKPFRQVHHPERCCVPERLF